METNKSQSENVDFFNMSGSSPTNNLGTNKERILFIASDPTTQKKTQHFSYGIRALRKSKIQNTINTFIAEGYKLRYLIVPNNTIAKENELLQDLDETTLSLWTNLSLKELIDGGQSFMIVHTQIVINLLKKLGIKSNLKEILLALLEISKAEIYFEASYSDLANLLYESDERKHYEKIRYALNTLQKWQEQNGLELIEIVERGGRRKTEDGKFKYEKTKFRFVLLERLAPFVSDGKELNLEEFLKDLGLSGSSSIRHKTKYHPRHQRRKDKNTILTKFRRLFHQAVELDENPIEYCKHILDEAQLLINDLREQQEKEKFIAEFEQLVDDSNKLEECNPVLHRAENYHLITREII